MSKEIKKSKEDIRKELKAKMEKDYGKGTLIGARDKGSVSEVISTGSIKLNTALGVMGLPKGRIVEIYGPESSGKTTLCGEVIAQAHENPDSLCAIVDAEHALDMGYMGSLGIDLDRLEISQPDYGEQALNIVDNLVKSGIYDVVVVDSVAALITKSELEGEVGDSNVGKQARMMSQALRKLTGVVEKSNTLLIFTNQLRDKIGVMFGCLHADMPILFTDGRSIPIKKVVEERIKGKVWSYNEDADIFEEKNITDWHFNGKVEKPEDFLHIETNSINGAGRFGITVTPNHEILTDNGWKEAKRLNIGDKLISKYESVMGIIKTDTVEVLSKRIASARQMRQKGKYDISIDGNHNYLSGGVRNGVVVHNSPETTTGGNALKFFASVRLDIRRISTNKEGEEAVSNRVRVKVVKNKVAPPFKVCEFNIEFGVGIDKTDELIEVAVDLDIINKSGSWFSYEGNKLGQGKNSVKSLLMDNEQLFNEIKEKSLSKLRNEELVSITEELIKEETDVDSSED